MAVVISDMKVPVSVRIDEYGGTVVSAPLVQLEAHYLARYENGELKVEKVVEYKL